METIVVVAGHAFRYPEQLGDITQALYNKLPTFQHRGRMFYDHLVGVCPCCQYHRGGYLSLNLWEEKTSWKGEKRLGD